MLFRSQPIIKETNSYKFKSSQYSNYAITETEYEIDEKISEITNSEVQQESKELIDYAFVPPSDPSKILIHLDPSSDEFLLIEKLFENGNCQLNSAIKTYRKSLVYNFCKYDAYGTKTVMLFFANTIEYIMEFIDRKL